MDQHTSAHLIREYPSHPCSSVSDFHLSTLSQRKLNDPARLPARLHLPFFPSRAAAVIMPEMEFESLEQIEQLPIFPLATVLFPGALLPLHIFEERYKEMMRYALDNGGWFGLSYRSDAEIGEETLLDADSVGCVARIHAVMPLDDGRMNMITTGVVRYHIREIKQIVPFIIARVETFTDDLEPESDLSPLLNDTLSLSKKFLALAQKFNDTQVPAEQDLPDDPEALSLLVCSMLPIDDASKHNLLETTSTRLRLTRVRHYLAAIIQELSKRAEIKDRAQTNGHAKLK